MGLCFGRQVSVPARTLEKYSTGRNKQFFSFVHIKIPRELEPIEQKVVHKKKQRSMQKLMQTRKVDAGSSEATCHCGVIVG